VFLAKPFNHILILAIHIDNCIFTGSFPDLISEYKSKFHACHVQTDLELIHWLLGIKISHDCSACTIFYLNEKSQCTSAILGYIAFEGE
jgi:hypothetical protein